MYFDVRRAHVASMAGGVYTNVALYPAVERGGALLRTSVMATHEREHLDRALEVFDRCRGALEGSS